MRVARVVQEGKALWVVVVLAPALLTLALGSLALLRPAAPAPAQTGSSLAAQAASTSTPAPSITSTRDPVKLVPGGAHTAHGHKTIRRHGGGGRLLH